MELSPSNPPPLPFGSEQKAKKSILAWWGIFPTILLIAIQVIIGWPEAKLRATAPEFAISYVVGSVIGGLLISYAIAWLVYRVGGRSQLVATITFSLMIAFVCLSVVARSRLLQSSNPGVTQPSTTPELASFGTFRFEIPAGWKKVQPDRETTIAMILLHGAEWNTAEGMLKVDFGKPSLPTARQMAQSLAGNDGRVLPDPISIDGIESIRIEMPSTDMSRPRFAVVVFREEKVYLIMAAAVNGVDVSGAFDQVVKSWRWNDSR